MKEVKDEKESFAHFSAKNIMVSWLRESSEAAGIDNYACFGKEIEWRVNRSGPYWGIFDEYPITEDFGPVWDEQYWWCKCVDHFKDPKCLEPERNWPDYKWIKKNYNGDFRIVDIAIQHKGDISGIIEIIHKNPLDRNKFKFLEKNLNCSTKIYQIPAKWILGQIKRPTKLPKEFRLN